MTYIGLDVGTSGLKAAVVSRDGRVLATSHREYALTFPRPGWVEIDPAAVWAASKEALAEIAPHAKDACALSVSTIGESLVLLNEHDEPLSNSILYLDERCREQAEAVARVIEPQALYAITGLPLSPMFSLCHYLWLREHRQELLRQAQHICLFGDFLTYMLSGTFAIDPSTASRTMMFDVTRLNWSREVFDAFDIPMCLFSDVVPTGTVAGTLRQSLSDELGLPQLSVVVGCHDQIAATLGAGVTQPGGILAGEGSSEGLNLVVNRDDLDEAALFARNICIEPFAVPGQYMVAIGLLSHGTCIKWFAHAHRHAYDGGAPLYEQAEALCAGDAGDLFFLPYLSRTSCMDASISAPACFLGLSAQTGVHEMYRALLEGLAFETRSNLQSFVDAGIPFKRIVACGGGAKSRLFMQIKADVLDTEIARLLTPDAGVIGLALICACAMGAFPDYETGARAFVHMADVLSPQRDYSEKYDTYRALNLGMCALYRSLDS